MTAKLLSTVAAGLICGVGLASASDPLAANGPAFVRLTPEQVRWQDVPGSPGVQIATLAGDPSGHGLYVQRVRFPPHIMDRPHWHPNDRHVTVLKGTWFTGTGATFAPSQAVPLKAGSYMLHPAKALHWDGSNGDEDVIVQIVGLGPADTVQADPSQPFWVRVQP
jgi:quercetin dioxygenase-like cupin family protein